MVVPNLLFDLVLFGALLIGMVLDSTLPVLHGCATLLAVGAITYIAAQELCLTIGRRAWWTQESLATALSLSVIGFVYFVFVNDSDLSLLVLSIGLMMASLMVAIAIIAAFGTAFRERRAHALAGFVLTTVGSLGLGGLASALILGSQNTGSPAPGIDWPRIGVVAVALVFWKIREALRPPAGPETAPATAGEPESGAAPGVASLTAGAPSLALESGGRWLVPQRGTLLDRYVPILVLGALLFLSLQQSGRPTIWSVTPPASAYSPANTVGQR